MNIADSQVLAFGNITALLKMVEHAAVVNISLSTHIIIITIII